MAKVFGNWNGVKTFTQAGRSANSIELFQSCVVAFDPMAGNLERPMTGRRDWDFDEDWPGAIAGMGGTVTCAGSALGVVGAEDLLQGSVGESKDEERGEDNEAHCGRQKWGTVTFAPRGTNILMIV
jgi:hypothetical protein